MNKGDTAKMLCTAVGIGILSVLSATVSYGGSAESIWSGSSAAFDEDTDGSETDIDIPYSYQPSVIVHSEDSEKHGADKGFFSSSRHIDIDITDEPEAFDDNVALESIKITAVDWKGDDMNIDMNKTAPEGWRCDGDKHSISLDFEEEGYYEWSLDYTDRYGRKVYAGKDNGDIEPDGTVMNDFVFCIDRNPPEAVITDRTGGRWNSLCDDSSGYVYKKDKPDIQSGESIDEGSGIKEILYYTKESEKILDIDGIRTAFKKGFFSNEYKPPDKEGGFVVYLRVSDRAGNVSYVSTPVIVYDRTKSRINLEIPEPDCGDFYNKDINVSLSVCDDESSEVVSGISYVSYIIQKDSADTGMTSAAGASQRGTLYKYTGKKGKLLNKWKGSFVIDASLNNADNVNIIAEAMDNAGNLTRISKNVNICSGRPEIHISMDGNACTKENGHGYFNSPRTAVISIRDRTSAFDKSGFEDGIWVKLKYGSKNCKPQIGEMLSKWTKSGDLYQVQLAFSGEGDYRWGISYTNKAGMTAKVDAPGESETPYDFTIDMTPPDKGIINIGGTAGNSLSRNNAYRYFSNKALNVELSGSDLISPVDIDYIIESGDSDISDKVLKTSKFKKYEKPFKLSKNGRSRILLRVRDYAGNTSFYHSDGIIIDSNKSSILLTPDKPNSEGIWHGDVGISVEVDDTENGSGIKNVSYYVLKRGRTVQSGTLYKCTGGKIAPGELKQLYKGKTIVDSVSGNGSDTIFKLSVSDNAGNVSSESIELDIDIRRPEISIAYDNNVPSDNGPYYHAQRTAVISIRERNSHFDGNKAKKMIKVKACDLNGGEIYNACVIGEWSVAQSGGEDEAIHLLKIQFNKDAVYDLNISYIDRAGNKNGTIDTGGSRNPFHFIIDRESPDVSIRVESEGMKTEKWTGLKHVISKEVISRENMELSCISADDISDVGKTEYLIMRYSDGQTDSPAFSAYMLDQMNGWKRFNKLSLKSEGKYVVFFRVSDVAGNRKYINTDYLVIDKTPPLIKKAAACPFEKKSIENGIFSSDVKIKVSVSDPVSGEASACISDISYEVYNDAPHNSTPTQSGVLYSSDKVNSKPVRVWNGTVRVKAAVNNSNNIKAVINVKDMAGNKSSKTVNLKIDITRPEINISFDRNDAINKKYFNGARKAFISVRERNFDPGRFAVSMRCSEGTEPVLSEWKTKKGEGNGDDTVWTTEIVFQNDAAYTFSASCSDLAGNSDIGVIYSKGTNAPNEFVIDQKPPELSVSYDTDEKDGGRERIYYNSEREARICVVDKNISTEDIKININTEKRSYKSNVPEAEKFETSGDIYKSRIEFEKDGRYSFEITCRDKAGNVSKKYESGSFCIDRTSPDISIEGVKDKEAESGVIKPVLRFSDDNIDVDTVSWSLKGYRNGDVDYPGTIKKESGRVEFFYDDFERDPDKDDIYTLTARAEDLAGNVTNKKITFYSDRYGSMFVAGQELENINRRYVRKASEITLTEYNVCDVKNEKLVLFTNDRSRELKKNVDYRISEAGGGEKPYIRTYTVYSGNFEEDGIYALMVSTEDKAGNISDNELNPDNAGVRFGVDAEPPVVMIGNIESGKVYVCDKRSVIIYARDNLKLKSVTAWLDGNKLKEWTEDALREITENNGNIRLEIKGDSPDSHTLKIEACDEAGNRSVSEAADFYITRDLKVRIIKEIWLPVSVISVVVSCLLFVIFVKRKKHACNGK